MSKLLRMLGAGKHASKEHELALPPIEDYSASPLLSELPDECRALVRKAGLLPEEAESNFGVLLSCLYFEMKHSPDVTAALKVLIRKDPQAARKGSGQQLEPSSTPVPESKSVDGNGNPALEMGSATERRHQGDVAHEDRKGTNDAPAEIREDTKPGKKKSGKKSRKKSKKSEEGPKEKSEESSACRAQSDEDETQAKVGQDARISSSQEGNVHPTEKSEDQPKQNHIKKKKKRKKSASKKAHGDSQEKETTLESEPGNEGGLTESNFLIGAGSSPCMLSPETQSSLPQAGRTRGFSFSFFRSPASSSSSPTLALESSSRKRFSASGLRPPATSSALKPTPSGRASKQAQGIDGERSRRRKQKPADDNQGEENIDSNEIERSYSHRSQYGTTSQQHHQGESLDAAAEASTSPPVREDLFIIDNNPSLLFSSKQKIGRGGFGDVYTGRDKSSNQIVAIKILKKPYSECCDQICNELEILRSCQHDNIVNYLRSYYYKDRVWMVMEYCDGGSLRSLISGVDLNEGQIANVLRKVLTGLKYLHQQNRIHRDIKAENILLNINGDVKIADLGLCAELKDSEDSKAGMVGSRYWMAPEIIKRERYNCKVDIWSVAATAMEMAQQHPPWHGLPSLRVLFNIATKGAPPLKQPKKWSAEFKDFLAQCFAMDPDQRPSAEQLLSHPFIAKASPTAKLEQAISIVFLGDSLKMNGF